MDSKNERLERLSEILRSWMEMKAPRQAIVDRKERFRSKNAEKKNTKEERLDVKFKCGNIFQNKNNYENNIKTIHLWQCL